MYIFLILLAILPIFVSLFSGINGLVIRLRLMSWGRRHAGLFFLGQLVLIALALASLGVGLYMAAGHHLFVMTAYILLPTVPLLAGLFLPLGLLPAFHASPRFYSFLTWCHSLAILCVMIVAMSLGTNQTQDLNHQLFSLGAQVLGLAILISLNLLHQALASASADVQNRRGVEQLRKALELAAQEEGLIESPDQSEA